MIALILFILSILAIAETYLFFPLRMNRAAKKYQGDWKEPVEYPSLALLVAAYNEEDVISQKIESMLTSDYPADKIHVIIGSDRSTDKTNDLVLEWSAKDSRVELVVFESRTGKPEIINQLVNACEADILILSDADTFFEPTTLTELVKPFSEDKIGGVQARFITSVESDNNVALQETLYNERELSIKKGESVEGAVIGAYGACYALRKKLYKPVPQGFLVDDFFIFMKILEAGYQTVLAEKAECLLEVSGASDIEFKRKTRIGTGNYQNFFALRKFFNPFYSKAASYYWSHKVLRWFTPLFLVLAFCSNWYLMELHPVFVSLLVTQIFAYVLALLDIPLRLLNVHLAPLRFISHFVSMNIALVLGFINYLKGNAKGTWK